MFLPGDSLEHKDSERQKIKGWNNICQAKSKKIKTSVLTHIADKTDFKYLVE